MDNQPDERTLYFLSDLELIRRWLDIDTAANDDDHQADAIADELERRQRSLRTDGTF